MAQAKVFLIDDDKFVLKSTSKKFRAYDVEVFTFLDPNEALEALVEHKPEIVFLDYNMPDLTGEELIVKVSEVKLFNHCALYLLSGNDFDANETVKLRTLGFYNVFKKPLDIKTIEEVFNMHLSEIPYLSGEKEEKKSS
jgi:DNA-binding NtrC family response regulator